MKSLKGYQNSIFCLENEIYSKGYNRCSESCDQAIMLCLDQLIEGCTCREGYLRNEFLGICVPKEECGFPGHSKFFKILNGIEWDTSSTFRHRLPL